MASVNQSLLSGMPDGPLVTALEMKFDQASRPPRRAGPARRRAKPSAEPAPILSERVSMPYVAPNKAAGPHEALQIALSESGRPDIDRMAELLGTTNEAVIAQMHDNEESPLIFKDP